MNTQPDTPAPQWAVEAAKELGYNNEENRARVAAIIARHAPHPASDAKLMQIINSAIRSFPHSVPYSLDLAACIVIALKETNHE